MNKFIFVGLLAICLMSICVEGQLRCPRGQTAQRICQAVCVPTCINADIRCPNPTGPRCPLRCACPSGLYLNQRNGKCVRLQDCPK